MKLQDIPRIRLTRDTDGLMIAKGGKKPFREDHLFERGGHGLFGIYVSRPTSCTLRNAIATYTQACAFNDPLGPAWRIAAQGDTEAILHFETVCPQDVPEWFKKSSLKVAMGYARVLTHKFDLGAQEEPSGGD